MDPLLAGRQRHGARSWLPASLIGVALTSWFGLLALATPFDHDESQYIAGAALSAQGLAIFRDYLYLQPPLHAWAYAPLADLFPGHAVLAMRLATALTAVVTVMLLWIAQRRAGISRSSAILAALAVAATAAFQFTGAVVRNDMLPTLLASAGIAAMLGALNRRATHLWLMAGAAFGFAISAKLNFAPLGAMAGLFTLMQGRRCGRKAASLLASGAAFGLLPLIVACILAPDAFLYGIFTYGANAPHAWYAMNGAEKELAFIEKLTDLLAILARGPALVALLLVWIEALFHRKHDRPSGQRPALWLTAGGLLGAALPTPSQVQYVMPLLPPLALALGYLLDDARSKSPVRRQLLIGLLVLAALPGFGKASRALSAMAQSGSPVLAAHQGGLWAEAQVEAQTGGDDVATLSPQMLPSTMELDPRFATGPFAYRTGAMVEANTARRLHMMTPATLPDMERDLPDAILTGYEGGTRKLKLRPDEGLIAFAKRHGYRVLTMPDRIGRLYLRPQTRR